MTRTFVVLPVTLLVLAAVNGSFGRAGGAEGRGFLLLPFSPLLFSLFHPPGRGPPSPKTWGCRRNGCSASRA